MAGGRPRAIRAHAGYCADMNFVNQVVTIVAVVVGAGTTHLVTALGDRAKDRREVARQWVDATSLHPPGEPPLFVVNSDAPADWQRFTLGHELGHVACKPGGLGSGEDGAAVLRRVAGARSGAL
jgi:IrrE N-terminal-like domain